MRSAHEFLQAKTHEKHLLAVPHSDVFGSNNESETTESSSKESAELTRYNSPPLLLIQFPDKNWSSADLRQGSFVVNSQSGLVHLVAEERARSYALHKVETSNALVVIPPPSSSSEDEGVKTQAIENVGDEPSPKRIKKQSSLHITHARLLQQGEGASFLELRQYELPWKLLYEKCMVNSRPALNQLANIVGCSTVQVGKALRSLRHALVQFPDQTVGPWPKHAFQQSLEHILESAILATLNEVGSDWQVLPENFHDLVIERIPPSIVDQVTDLKHWIDQTLQANSLSSSDMTEKAVARLVARNLFRQRTKWPSADFWKRWNLEMPGTEASLNASYLKGLAVQTTEHSVDDDENASERVYWVSLPLDALHVVQNDGENAEEDNCVSSALKKLFEIQAMWNRHDLEPYLEHLRYWFGHKDTSEYYDQFLRIEKSESGTDFFQLKIADDRIE